MSDIVKEINKKFGDGAIFKLGDRNVQDIPVFSTGILGLDAALGIKGFPKGRITEVVGGTGVGKTSLCLGATASAQLAGEKVAFIDMEHALSVSHAEKFGVVLDDLMVVQPNSGNEALAITKLLIESGEFGMVVIDSVAALLPEQEESQEEFGSSNVGLHARLMAQACRKLTPLASKHNVALVFINQYRTSIASMGYGDMNVPTGGNSLKFFASVRVELKRLNQIKSGEDIVGHKIHAKVLKNKCFRPFIEYEYSIYYDSDCSGIDEVVDLAIEYGFIKKGGAWYTIGTEKFQGTAKVKAYLAENDEIYDALRKNVVESLQKYVIEGQKLEKKIDAPDV